MKPKNSASMRAPGQRSIPSTFLFRATPKCSSNFKEGSDPPSKQGSDGGRSYLSLSAFLDRKLHSASVLPTQKVEKGKKLSPLFENKHPNGSSSTQDQKRPVIEDSVFKLFSDKQGAKTGMASPEGMADLPTDQPTPEGDVKKHSKSHVVILGDDPKPKRTGYADFSGSNKRPRPFYNHYKTGTGWWDSEREGIDEDEVGAKEIWEGVGSATLGGLEWH